MPALEQAALLKCWSIERTSGFGDIATLASSVCSAALDLAKVGGPAGGLHLGQLHRAADTLLELRDRLEPPPEEGMNAIDERAKRNSSDA